MSRGSSGLYYKSGQLKGALRECLNKLLNIHMVVPKLFMFKNYKGIGKYFQYTAKLKQTNKQNTNCVHGINTNHVGKCMHRKKSLRKYSVMQYNVNRAYLPVYGLCTILVFLFIV